MTNKRQSPTKGVNDFSFTGNRLLIHGGKTSLFYADVGEIPKFVTHEVPALDDDEPRMDPKLCPGDVNFMAFYRNGNLWLQNISNKFKSISLHNKSSENHGEVFQLTTAGQENKDFKGIYAGWVNYLIQEEFDRYSGYYWQETSSRTQRIVYEVSDESELETLTYVNHVAVAQKICRAGGATSGNARSAAATEAVFPSTGSENPKTDIRYLEFELPGSESEDNFNVRRHKLPMPLMEVNKLNSLDNLNICSTCLGRKRKSKDMSFAMAGLEKLESGLMFLPDCKINPQLFSSLSPPSSMKRA